MTVSNERVRSDAKETVRLRYVTMTSTLAFAEVFEEAGFPPGVFNVLTGSGAALGEADQGPVLDRGRATTG